MCRHISRNSILDVAVSQYLLHMPQAKSALGTAGNIAEVRNLAKRWGMCSKDCHTQQRIFLGCNRIETPAFHF